VSKLFPWWQVVVTSQEAAKVEPFGPDSFPSSRVVDLFQPRIHTHAPPSRKDNEVTKYKTSLDVAWAAACGDESCCVVVADASVPSDGIFQAAAAALVFRQGRQEACVVSAAGRRMPPEVERFALQLGISAALAKGCQKLVIFSDSLSAVKSLFDVELRSGQIFSLDACRAVGPWLAGDPDCSVHLWFIPSCLEWGVQKQAHNAAVALKIAVGRRPRTSRDFMLQRFDVEASKAWHKKFKDPLQPVQLLLYMKLGDLPNKAHASSWLTAQIGSCPRLSDIYYHKT
jgi:hypothetical protein